VLDGQERLVAGELCLDIDKRVRIRREIIVLYLHQDSAADD
jgi:hypothetical protein